MSTDLYDLCLEYVVICDAIEAVLLDKEERPDKYPGGNQNHELIELRDSAYDSHTALRSYFLAREDDE